MPNVEVKDSQGKLIHTYEIIVAEYGTLVSIDDVLDMARQNAMDDELVSEDGEDKLFFSVVEGA